jgi:hypothetical protein
MDILYIMISSVATKAKQNKSIFYSCPGAAGSTGPIGPSGPAGANGTIGPTGPKGDAGSFTGDLIMAKGIDIDITDSPVDNYILIGNHSFYLITSSNDTSADITGIATGSLGRALTIVNTSSVVQTFIEEDTRSGASNRFVLGETSKSINVNRSISFIYVTGLTIGSETGESRWVMTSST